MTREFRVFGPPGTGKTTYLARQIKNAAMEFGSDNVMVTSFTKAAAVEIASRKIAIDRDNVGTLHSHCYRALGWPEIAESHIDEFNQGAPAIFTLSTAKKSNIDEPDTDRQLRSSGDELAMAYQILRGKMVDREMWPASVAAFARKWEDWKKSSGYMDFTDLLETAYRDIDRAPNNPSVAFVDEAQDLNPLSLALIRKWGERMDWFIIAGDDDQAIFSFVGCSPEAFLNPPLESRFKHIQRQSYRVPTAIQKWSQEWIKQIQNREPKDYRPRDARGEIVHADSSVTWKTPYKIIQLIESYLKKDKTVMILTTCGYMLEPLKKALREEGIPFHNPYRRSNGGWNPLFASRGNSATSKLLAFLKTEKEVWGELALTNKWTVEDLLKWVPCVKKRGSGLQGGIEVWLRQLTPKEKKVPVVDIFDPKNENSQIFVFEGLEQRVEWLREHLVSNAERGMQFPLKVLEKRGPGALREEPGVTVGTIHSVKGGESDVVILFPDLSQAGFLEWATPGEKKDSVIRLFYVGATRARETLIMGSAATNLKVNLI